jgi:chemotaxis signal transduction protein
MGLANPPRSNKFAPGRYTLSTLYRTIEFLRFEVASRSFCVDVDEVLGVITLPPNLMEAPSIVPFHNDHIRVFSVERLLELEPRHTPCPKEIIVLTGAGEDYGLSVDLIGQIYKVPIHRSVFRFPASGRSRIKMFGIWGMAILGNELALILEPQQLFKEQSLPGGVPADARPGPVPVMPPRSDSAR